VRTSRIYKDIDVMRL